MNLFKEILIESFLLTESVSVDNITNAINGLHPVWITYDDKKGGGGKARRIIYPVAYGTTTAGNPVIRAFQPQGSSKRGLTTPPNDRELPKWKFFRVDRIKFWRTVNSKKFNENELVGFNDEGDKSMSEVYLIAPIGNAKKINRNNIQTRRESGETPTKSFEPRPITKDEVENININTKVQPSQKKYNVRNTIDSIISNIKNSLKKQDKNLDNTIDKSYIDTASTINAPDTKPVTKDEIGTSVNDTEKISVNQNIKPNTEPVTKDEIENTDNSEDLKESILSKSYNDMMERINNLYK